MGIRSKTKFAIFVGGGREGGREGWVHVANPVAITRIKAMSMDTVKHTCYLKRNRH